MGNAGSQNGQISQSVIQEERWAHSFPKTQPTKLSTQHKVLPERDVQLKLRSTNNGEILHSGGTLSGRHSNKLGDKYNEYPTHGFKEHIPPARKYFPKERDPQHKSRAQGVQHKLSQNASSQNKSLHGQMKLYVSEPDLRYPSNQECKDKRSKKKYKAPPPPQNLSREEQLQLVWTNDKENFDSPIRKARLFKTRAETKKQSSHVQELSSMEYSGNTNPKEKSGNLTSNRLSLPEMKLGVSDNFYKELKEATKRLRHIELDNKTSIRYDAGSEEKLKTFNHNAINTEDVKEKLMEKTEEDAKSHIENCARGEASGKESTTPEMSPNLNSKGFNPRDKPRTFYFGMNESNDNLYTDEMFDSFAANLHQKTKIPHSSESDISSCIDSDENDVSRTGIDLQLRPILPKKQLEIPRFSPAAAWRLLSMDTNDNTAATTASDDVPVFVEERIEKYARHPPPFVHAGQRSSNDKSGDSGISGDDAIPVACYEDNNDSGINQENHVPAGLKMLSYLNNHERISWTPQQDLGDDSSIEECIDDKVLKQKLRTHIGPHLFSLSLPRDNQLASYMIEKSNSQYSGLQRLKKSLSGVLNNLSNKKDYIEANLADEKGSNWFLSKSAPNSLNNAFHSLEMRKSQECELIYSQNKTSRLMYLPEIDLNRSNYRKDKDYDINTRDTPSLSYSKSCEDIAFEVRREPEPLQDPTTKHDLSWQISRKPKKFTFQSTIRQIEKKRLSDKLSKEAERREKKRIQELEAMQKVEEEFQKKRAREKANIRQQLRLYCLDEDPTWSSLPPNLKMKNGIRPEPDGAFSSSTSSSPLPHTKSPNSSRSIQKFRGPELNTEIKMKASTTRELSEFRQVQRDYKEYRGSYRYSNDGGHRQTTVHPQITCNMPKAKGVKPRESSNYRKDFASGVKSTLSARSTHSEDSQNPPRMYNKNEPMSMSYLDHDLIHC